MSSLGASNGAGATLNTLPIRHSAFVQLSPNREIVVWADHGGEAMRIRIKKTKGRKVARSRIVMARDIRNKQVLDTSAWNNLYDDPKRDGLVKVLRTKVILRTAVAISELAAIEDPDRRHAIVRLIKTLGRDNRPLAMPNQLIVYCLPSALVTRPESHHHRRRRSGRRLDFTESP